MRDRILRALRWALRLLLPAHGEHRTTKTTTPTAPAETAPVTVTVPVSISVWRKPWRGPSSAQVRAIFHAEEDEGLTLEQREHRWAVRFEAIGVDYPQRYKGDHFEQLACARRAGVPA
ncbi:hypothetical protein I5Q34_19700 [Streptomyces sp. AV19]|uniref:hypothetical protein n=1 Tax=Streptomyces sp. AV19 TaxID=2793068 RepID=UPI0018FEF8EB|nr:hypothetical protein [Streptomyces sp. AV19]MBH1936473.1 hypothetical protein [Streptomyces sp. AV19]MDG4532529.1 hypothetical protein [Streptomyces sp. AV19]